MRGAAYRQRGTARRGGPLFLLLASTEFRTMFLDRMDPYAWEESEMWILLRRVATFTATGR